jgi:anaerobic ribonucleoside-triphosphate reductase activating protein
MYWKLNRIQYPIYNLGPGKRIGIWVQGCSIRCPGCVSQTLWTSERGQNIFVPELVQFLLDLPDDYAGVTVSGGEPFDQYAPLIAFAALLKRKTDLTIFCFTGYYLEELRVKYPDQLFLRYLDYLLDGRYNATQHENENVRGSANQTLYQIVNGQPQKLDTFFKTDKWSIQVNENNQIFMAGIPKKGDLEKLTTDLQNSGIIVRFE